MPQQIERQGHQLSVLVAVGVQEGLYLGLREHPADRLPICPHLAGDLALALTRERGSNDAGLLKQRAGNIYSKPGDAIQGEKITAQARRIHRMTVSAGTSTHQIQNVKLEGSVFCIIDRPLNYIREVPEKTDK